LIRYIDGGDIMKLKLIVAAVTLGAASTAYAMDTTDVEDVSMQAVDSMAELPDAAMRELSLPETASDRAVERAQQREGYGLSRANEVRAAHQAGSGDDAGDDMGDTNDDGCDDMADSGDTNDDGGDMADSGDTNDDGGDMADSGDMENMTAQAVEDTAGDAVDAAQTVAEATAKAQEAVANASDRAQEAVANATEKAQSAIENARNAAAGAAEHASDKRPGA
jgi:gas vesicle protein